MLTPRPLPPIETPAPALSPPEVLTPAPALVWPTLAPAPTLAPPMLAIPPAETPLELTLTPAFVFDLPEAKDDSCVTMGARRLPFLIGESFPLPDSLRLPSRSTTAFWPADTSA